MFRLKDDAPDKKTLVGSKINGNSSSALITPGSGDSPLGNRKRSGSTGEESTNRISNGGDVSIDFDLLKQELITEIRKEMNKVKQEIIEGTIILLSTRRSITLLIYQILQLFDRNLPGDKNVDRNENFACHNMFKIAWIHFTHTNNFTLSVRAIIAIYSIPRPNLSFAASVYLFSFCNHDSVDIFSVSYSRIFYVDSWLARIFLMEIR